MWFSKHFGRVLEDKKTPEWVFSTSPDLRRAFLDGLIASDGCLRYDGINHKRYSLVTASRRMAADFCRLLMSLGHKPSMYVINNDSLGAYSINFSSKKTRLMEVKSVLFRSPTKKERLFDLTVEGEPSFIVGTAVVHNCWARVSDLHGAMVYVPILRGTVEEPLARLIQRKQETASSILDGGEGDRVDLFDMLCEQVLGTGNKNGRGR